MTEQKIHLVQGDHQECDPRLKYACQTAEKADEMALELVNIIRGHQDLPPAAGDWRAALKEAQLDRIKCFFGGAVPKELDLEDDEVRSETSECDVWIEVIDLH